MLLEILCEFVQLIILSNFLGHLLEAFLLFLIFEQNLLHFLSGELDEFEPNIICAYFSETWLRNSREFGLEDLEITILGALIANLVVLRVKNDALFEIASSII